MLQYIGDRRLHQEVRLGQVRIGLVRLGKFSCFFHAPTHRRHLHPKVLHKHPEQSQVGPGKSLHPRS